MLLKHPGCTYSEVEEENRDFSNCCCFYGAINQENDFLDKTPKIVDKYLSLFYTLFNEMAKEKMGLCAIKSIVRHLFSSSIQRQHTAQRCVLPVSFPVDLLLWQ